MRLACGYLSPMTELPQPCFISIAEYLEGEENSPVKHEYFGGIVHAMAGATNQHNAVAISSIIAIGSQLRGKPCQPFNSDTKIRIEFSAGCAEGLTGLLGLRPLGFGVVESQMPQPPVGRFAENRVG